MHNKIDKQRGFTVEHSEQYSKPLITYNGKNSEKDYIYMDLLSTSFTWEKDKVCVRKSEKSNTLGTDFSSCSHSTCKAACAAAVEMFLYTLFVVVLHSL